VPPRASACFEQGKGQEIIFERPTPADGPAISALIAACPPLDRNSAYCNLLQCTDFADSCIVARQDGTALGWVSGYRPPAARENFFVWQVAVSAAARGQRLAGRMIDALLARPEQGGVTYMTTTITSDNDASWRLFEGLARRWNAAVEKHPRFERETHFAGAHATEWQVRIGPLASPAQASGDLS